MKKHIPNLITLGNLLCGTIAVIFAIKGDFIAAAVMVSLGILLDFFDGFFARILNVQAELGKQLDSLADMVTSGVVPGIVMLKLLEISIDKDTIGYFGVDSYGITGSYLPFLGLLLTLGAGYRLAKFNIDTRQSESFIGLPTPAMSLFIISLPIIVDFSTSTFFTTLILNKWFLILVTLLFTYLMNAELPLFSLKFKSFSFKKNWIKYVFLILSILIIILFQVVSLPLIIILYIIFSILNNLITK